MTNLNVGLIGYGEVGKIFSNGLKAKGLAWVGAWDVIFGDAVFGGAQRLHATAHGVEPCESASAVCAKATLIMSAVTASNTLAVAQEIARDPSRHRVSRSQFGLTQHRAKGCGAD